MKQIKIIATLGLLLAFAHPVFLAAQDIVGTWHGKIQLPNVTLTLVFHINRTEDGKYTTTCDSPDQGVKGIQTASTSFQDSTLIIQLPIIHASYQGKQTAENKIVGTFTQGVNLPLTLEKGEVKPLNRPQEPRPPYPYKTEEVRVQNIPDDITLAGTLTLPEKGNKFPAVVLVTGSGAQNRDEEIMGHKPFLVIADYLTRHGIAVLRCDDRGVGSSQGNSAVATDEDFARDTEAALEYLRSRKEIDTRKVGIIGHSCGGTIAFRVAAKDANVAFVISLAGSAVRGDSLMLKQVELISKADGMPDSIWQSLKPTLRHRYGLLKQTDKTPEEIRKEVYADVVRYLSNRELSDINLMQQINAQVNSMTSPWYLHFMRYDPTEDLRKIKCPVFALNGEKDVQVDADMNLTAIRVTTTENGNKNVKTKSYPKLNHLFQNCQKGTVAEYGQLEETISPEVLKDMTDWILKH